MRILVVDDDPGALRAVCMALEREHEIVACDRGEHAIAALRGPALDLVLTDLGMEPPDGFDLMRAVQGMPAPPPVVVITGLDRARTAIEAMRLGAVDLLVKPATREEICEVVRRIEAERPGLAADERDVSGFVGNSPVLRLVCRMVPLLARSNEAVLILGETGTGKELYARALHAFGSRRDAPFVAHNMAATPAELAESVFFGHVKGAFSGASADHAGLFETAAGGTLFLDEVDSFPLPLQAKLLRVLEGGRVQRVGSSVERTVDVRVISASATELEEPVKSGRFRADLYYRLRQLEVRLPRLRDHMEDLPALARHFLAEAATPPAAPLRLSTAALDLLMRHHWPGNCRELRNALRSAVVVAVRGPIQPAHLPPGIVHAAQTAGPGEAPLSLLAAEREQIRQALEHAAGNRTRAARLLGIDRGTLARKLRALDLDRPAR